MRTKTPYVRVKLDQWALVSFLCGFFLYRQKNWDLKPINENTENFFKILRGMFLLERGIEEVERGNGLKCHEKPRSTTLSRMAIFQIILHYQSCIISRC